MLLVLSLIAIAIAYSTQWRTEPARG